MKLSKFLGECKTGEAIKPVEGPEQARKMQQPGLQKGQETLAPVFLHSDQEVLDAAPNTAASISEKWKTKISLFAAPGNFRGEYQEQTETHSFKHLCEVDDRD